MKTSTPSPWTRSARAVPDNNESDTGEVAAPDDAPTGDESDAGETPAPDKDESDAGEVVAADDNSAAEEPAAPADPIIASLEPVAEQVSTAAMLAGDGIIGTITDDCISAIEPVTYNGEAQTPNVVVNVGGTTLVKGQDYNVDYSNNLNAGTATVKVTGTGNYDGEAYKTFTINKADCEVEVKLKSGYTITKVYDKTRNLKVTSSYFEFSPSKQLSTDTLKFASITGSYPSADVGEYDITITFTISQSGANYNYKLKNDGKFTFKGSITPKKLTVRPGVKKKDASGNVVKDANGKNVLETQTKVYGTANPSTYSGVVDGVLEGDSVKVTGKLTREEGENVGKYKIKIGNVTIKGKNYEDNPPNLEDAYFEITPKPINDKDIGIGSIGNQQYTGSAITPDGEIKLRYGTKTLTKGTDYTLSYSDNVGPGTATVTITGKGNYTGTRTATFRIMKTSSSTTSSSSNSSSSKSSSSSSSGNSSSSDDDDDDDEEETKKKYTRAELEKMSEDELNDVAEEYDIDPDDYDSKDALIDAILKAQEEAEKDKEKDDDGEDEDRIGELVLDDEHYGTILFSADDEPRPFLLYEEEVKDEDDEDEESEDEEDEEDEDGEGLEDEDDELEIIGDEGDEADEGDEGDEAEEGDEDEADAGDGEKKPVKKRLRIEALNMQDEEENDLPLTEDEENDRLKFEELHLKLTPSHIKVLKSKGFSEVVYEYENGELVTVVGSIDRTEAVLYYPGTPDDVLLYGQIEDAGIMTLPRLVYIMWLMVGIAASAVGLAAWVLLRKRWYASRVMRAALVPVCFTVSLVAVLWGHFDEVYNAAFYLSGICLLAAVLYALALFVLSRRVE